MNKATTSTLAIIALSGVLASSLVAQENGRPKRHGKRPAQALIEKFDSDGDGKLSESERAAAKAAMAERRAAADADGDGTITKEERLAAFKQRLSENEELAARVLQRFDADENGELSEEELAKAAKAGKRLRERARERNRKPKGRRANRRNQE